MSKTISTEFWAGGLAATIAAAMLLFGQNALADGRGPHGPDMDRLTQELDLSEEQAEQVKTILDESRAQGREMMSKYRGFGDREAARAEMEALRDETDQRLAEVLDAEQLSKLQEHRARRMSRRQEHGARRGPRQGSGDGSSMFGSGDL